MFSNARTWQQVQMYAFILMTISNFTKYLRGKVFDE